MTSCTDRFYHLQTGVWIAYLMHFIPCEAFLWKASSHRHALLEPLFYVSDDQEEDPSQQPSAVNWLEHEPPVSITTINSGSTLLHGILMNGRIPFSEMVWQTFAHLCATMI